MSKTIKTIVVEEDTWEKLHILKLRWKLPTLDDVIKKLMSKHEELNFHELSSLKSEK